MNANFAAVACIALGLGLAASAHAEGPLQAEPQRGAAANAGDHPGCIQRSRVSYYGQEFNGRPMANGHPFRPNSQFAASESLLLGTTAHVTNLQNGRSTTVRVEDRGFYGSVRMLDVSPQAAQQLGMQRDGEAPVDIGPVQVT